VKGTLPIRNVSPIPGAPLEQCLDDNRSHDSNLGCGTHLGAGEQPPADHLPFARHQIVGIDSRDQRHPVSVSGHERHGPRQQRRRDLRVDHLASDRRSIFFS
jgi:hypothetical protein